MSKDFPDIYLRPYEALFRSSGSTHNRVIPIEEIDEFPKYRFNVNDDEDMEKLVESNRENGLITSVIIRKVDDRYQTISGHRRLRAYKILGKESIKAEVTEATDEEATIMMADANYQRTSIKPSEKAYAYKMILDALNKQGIRTDLTFSQVEKKVEQW